MHVHTYRCKHAKGTAEDMVKAALQKKIACIGINEHFPMTYLPDPVPVHDYAMDLNEFPVHLKELKTLQKKYRGQIDVRIGAEVDYYEPAINTITQWLEPFQTDFDYLYGSVHVVTNWAIDDDKFLNRWDQVGVDAVYSMYYEVLAKMAKTRLFNVVGHLDLPKKFKKIPTIDFDGKISTVLDAVKAAHMVVEVNTAGLRKPVKEIYPSRHILEMCLEKGIKVTLGSDAHAPEEIGYAFDETRALLKEIGFKTLVLFKKRMQVPVKL